MYKKAILVGAILMFCSPSFSLQLKILQDNQTASAFVSSNDKTLIFVDGERISDLYGTQGSYVYQNDAVNGRVFITPTSAFIHKPFSIFVVTAKGRSYGLHLTPQDGLSKTIMIEPMEEKSVLPLPLKNIKKRDKFDSSIMLLMQAMVKGVALSGYQIIDVHKTKPIKLSQGTTEQSLKTYVGQDLKGVIYRLTNQSHYPITIHRKAFYQKNTRAVALQSQTILAGQSTILYGVYGHDQ